MKHILKCPVCGSYTFKDTCVKCKSKTISPRPPKYSPEDKFGAYRRKVKEDILKEEGLL
ncbi:nucleolar RNA-binding Nop10p family protein [Nanoarchaeota archaeon]